MSGFLGNVNNIQHPVAVFDYSSPNPAFSPPCPARSTEAGSAQKSSKKKLNHSQIEGKKSELHDALELLLEKIEAFLDILKILSSRKDYLS